MTSSRQTDSPIPFTLAIPEHPRSRAIIDGTVKAEGLHLNCIHEFKSAGERHSGMVQGIYDASEMNTIKFIQIRSEGGNQLALPVFWVRGFRQGSIICRKDSSIKTFSDLKNKTIGVTQFFSSGITWSRNMLHHDYGVTRDSVNWISAQDKSGPPASAKVKFTALAKTKETLWEMLGKGEIDAAIFTGNEGYFSFNPGGNLYQEMQKRENFRTIQDDKQNIAEKYKKSGIYPIMHTVTIKLDMTKKYPWLAQSVLQMFRNAREMASEYETDKQKEQSAEEIRFLGYDPYSCKLHDVDKKSLDALMTFMVEEGSLQKKLPVESLFAEGTI